MPSPIASAGIVLAAFLTGLLGPRLLHGGASGSHADRIRASELQQANTVLQQKLRVASDTLQQLQRSHGATIEDLSQKISAMEGSSSEDGGAGGGGGGGMLRKCRRQLEACRQKELTPAAVERPLLSAAVKPGGMHAENDTLLAVHRKWDWKTIVQDMMIGWPRIEPDHLETRTLALALTITLNADPNPNPNANPNPYPNQDNLETAVAACNDNGTMYCSRMQVIDGSLYLTDYRAIFFDRHYAPSRVMPLLETLRRNPTLPNMDIVVAGNDDPCPDPDPDPDPHLKPQP
jgi:hypothetical protein